MRTNDLRGGVRFAFGSLFDPGPGRYVFTPPGPASGGNAAIHSFIDNEADGRFGPGDEAAERVAIEGGERSVVTGPNGRAIVTGLGVSPSGRLQMNIQDIDNLYVGAPPANIQFAPRPGQVLKIPYPLVPAGEVYAKLMLRQDDENVGLSAVRVMLVREGTDPTVATTEYDGSVVFSDVPLGTYRLELDQSQAERLKMRLKKPVNVTVTTDGTSDVEAEVIFDTGKIGG